METNNVYTELDAIDDLHAGESLENVQRWGNFSDERMSVIQADLVIIREQLFAGDKEERNQRMYDEYMETGACHR